MPRQQMSSTGASERLPRGYSLIELMVSMTIGLVILAGLTTILANNSRTRSEIERAHQQTENGRYALQLLTDDLHNAGYFAEFNPGTVTSPSPALTVPTAIPDPCATDLASLKTNIAVPVQGYDNTASIPGCLADVKTGTDILVIRRASTCAVGDTLCDPQVASAPYFQASACGTQLQANNSIALDTNTANLTLSKRDCATQAPLRQYRTHIYFIANSDKPGDGIPTLKRADLGPGPAFTTPAVPLVEGVENLQLEYGLDTSAPTTGSPAVYTADPNTYNGCAPAACINYWRNTVSVKINLLARNTTTTPGYTDAKSYTLGRQANGTLNTVSVPSGAAGYKRHVYQSVVRLNNLAGRNTP
jgi:type IV pilus assembly protein PilW